MRGGGKGQILWGKVEHTLQILRKRDGGQPPSIGEEKPTPTNRQA